MNSYIVNVEPKEFVTVKVANSVELRVQSLNIGYSVELTCLLKDTNDNIFEVKNISLSGEEYNNWGNDDSYLVTTVLSKLGLTPLQSPVFPN